MNDATKKKETQRINENKKRSCQNIFKPKLLEQKGAMLLDSDDAINEMNDAPLKRQQKGEEAQMETSVTGQT